MTTVPWSQPAAWREAILAMDRLLGGLARGGAPEPAMVAGMLGILGRLDHIMAELGNNTCRFCPNPCCAHALVYYDWPDLLFLRLAGLTPPSEQIRRTAHGCPHLDPLGCRLPRTIRPWICTWYVCSRQLEMLRAHDAPTLQEIESLCQQMKAGRRRMEQWVLDHCQGDLV